MDERINQEKYEIIVKKRTRKRRNKSTYIKNNRKLLNSLMQTMRTCYDNPIKSMRSYLVPYSTGCRSVSAVDLSVDACSHSYLRNKSKLYE